MNAETLKTWALRLGGTAALLSLSACITTAPKTEAGVRESADVMCKIGISTCVAVIVPPAMPEAASYKTVAVVGKSGGNSKGADVLATRMESLLSKVRVESQLYYTLVPPNDPKREATFEVTTNGYNSEDRSGTDSRCRDPKKLVLFQCMKPEDQRQVPCTIRKVSLGATIRLQPAKGGSAATHQESASVEKKFCQGDTGSLPLANDMTGDVIVKLADKLQDTFAIRSEMRQMRVMDKADDIANGERKARFNEAVVFMKAGRLDRACGVFNDLSEIERNSVAVLYNAGFCAEARGNWAQANARYRAADALTRAPNNDIYKAIQETQLTATTSTR